MAHLNISNLNSAGSDLFAGADSFLTELQTTDTTQIFGGNSQRRSRDCKKASFKICNKTSYKVVRGQPVRCATPPKKWC